MTIVVPIQKAKLGLNSNRNMADEKTILLYTSSMILAHIELRRLITTSESTSNSESKIS